MATPLVTSDGFICGRLRVPPFRLARGECLQVIAPTYDDELAIAATFTDPPAGLRIAGRVRFLQAAWDVRGRIARLIRPTPTAADWIARNAAIPLYDATALLAEFGFDLDPRTRISHLPGNYRALIGLAAAWAGRPDVLVFTTSGIDWTGRQWLVRQITARLNHWAPIELSCPHFSQGRYQVNPSILSGETSITAEEGAVGMTLDHTEKWNHAPHRPFRRPTPPPLLHPPLHRGGPRQRPRPDGPHHRALYLQRRAAVPPFLVGRGKGWLTAEYGMLPGSTNTRKARDRGGKIDGRSSKSSGSSAAACGPSSISSSSASAPSGSTATCWKPTAARAPRRSTERSSPWWMPSVLHESAERRKPAVCRVTAAGRTSC